MWSGGGPRAEGREVGKVLLSPGGSGALLPVEVPGLLNVVCVLRPDLQPVRTVLVDGSMTPLIAVDTKERLLRAAPCIMPTGAPAARLGAAAATDAVPRPLALSAGT